MIITFLPRKLGQVPFALLTNRVEFLCAKEDPTTLERGGMPYAIETGGENLMGKKVPFQFGGKLIFASLRC